VMPMSAMLDLLRDAGYGSAKVVDTEIYQE
jgi:hypothetical protein